MGPVWSAGPTGRYRGEDTGTGACGVGSGRPRPVRPAPALTVRPRPGPDHNVLDAVGDLDQNTAERRSGC
ncbi:hypothetical protein GCM10010441_03070 [Kitasatospora paracochleata]